MTMIRNLLFDSESCIPSQNGFEASIVIVDSDKIHGKIEFSVTRLTCWMCSMTGGRFQFRRHQLFEIINDLLDELAYRFRQQLSRIASAFIIEVFPDSCRR